MNKLSIFFIVTGMFSNVLFAQSEGSTNLPIGPVICVAETAQLRNAPNPASKSTAQLQFGETIERLGEESSWKEGEQIFLKVETADKLVGWIDEADFATNGSLATFLAPERIYIRPNTPSTITTQQFGPGEVVVMTNVVGEWVQLVAKNRVKAGWVKGLESVSIEPKDVELASLLNSTLLEKNPAQKQRLWTDLFRESEKEGSNMYDILVAFFQAEYPGQPLPLEQTTVRARAVPSASSPTPAQRLSPPVAKSRTDRFFDERSNKWFTQKAETGGLTLMANSRSPRQSYQLAHKSLAKGTKVLVEMPDDQGYIQMVVGANLPENSPYVIGISQQTASLFFGEKLPQEITIYYLTE